MSLHLQHTPRVNTNDDEVQLVAWHLSPGEPVQAGQEIADVETSKAVVGVEAERSGYLRPLVAVGDIVAVGAPLALIADSADEALAAGLPAPVEALAGTASALAPVAPVLAVAPPPHAPLPVGELGTTRFSPAALRRLQELGLSPDAFAGHGLLSLRELESLLQPGSAAASSGSGQALSLAKRAETAALQLGAQGGVVSHLTVRLGSERIRRRLERENLFDGQPLALILYELARLLPQYPNLNAWCDGERLHLRADVLIGLALDLGQGLKVVNLPELHRQLPAQIHAQLLDAAQRYLDKRLQPEELEGGSFSVTDLSGLDVLQFRPLINGRQAAILGIGGDSQAPGQPLTLTLAFDHRCSNGREVGQFLGQLRERLLAYADPAPPETDAGAPLAAVLRGLQACDLCGIPREAYYREFGRYAFLQAYVREDGSLGAACHRCSAGTA